MRRTTIILVAAVAVIVLLLSSVFIVDERQKALVLQFGQIRDVKEEPGLAFKVPLIQEVVRYDDRILSLDTDPIEVTPSDDRRLVVDAFARYRIADVEQFRRAVGVGGIRAAESRLASILTTQTRAVLGSDGVTSNTILSSDRAALMTRIRDEARRRSAALGLEVIDVRLKQTALPEQNLAATFERMRAEREREATDERARGEEAAQRVRALADRTVVELVSEAQKESEIVRGEADARRSGIFAEAFSADQEFFEFYRSLTAYQRSLNEGNSTLILSPDSSFFDYLKSDQPRGRVQPAPAASANAGGTQTGASAPAAASGDETPPAETQTGAQTGSGTGDERPAGQEAPDGAADTSLDDALFGPEGEAGSDEGTAPAAEGDAAVDPDRAAPAN
ncbi:protease modulator HflC [Profundibacterium mesophilum]|uniref:HFLC protein n=1 Tax=Profundibacterium mesophilum KAUST100406-0324 TaxID=1037889 RepID=A0A921TF56_9RHOB|nr:protease modulator HflC [Profundibacterium mesophilum]KAF0676139.1 HFLC protein [Profundibacterium mesophilum KAUST100406-0324]